MKSTTKYRILFAVLSLINGLNVANYIFGDGFQKEGNTVMDFRIHIGMAVVWGILSLLPSKMLAGFMSRMAVVWGILSLLPDKFMK